MVHDTGSAGIVKLLYASAFRDPTVYERFYTTPAYAYGNPDIRSERMQSVEAGWEKRVGSGRLVATAYLFRLSDLIAPDSVTGVVRNSPALTGRGLEFEFEQRWRERYSLRAGYTLQEIRSDGGRPENTPRHMLKANLGADLGRGFFSGFETQYVSRRLTGDASHQSAGLSLIALRLSRSSLLIGRFRFWFLGGMGDMNHLV